MTSGTPIDLSQLPPPDVVEPLDFEAVFAAMLADLRERDPEFDALVESDPAYKILQTAAYRELLIRQRVNDAGRAVMLAYATATDLDNLAALLGVARLPGESDTALRRRAQLSLEGFSTAGPRGAYMFHSLSALAEWPDPDEAGESWTQAAKDAAVVSDQPGTVTVYVLAAPPEPSADGLDPDWGPDDGRSWGLRIRRADGYPAGAGTFACAPLPAPLENGWRLWFSGGAALTIDASASPGDTAVSGTLSAPVADGEAGGLISAVEDALNAETVRPLSDTVRVRTVEVLLYSVTAGIIIRPGPDTALVLAQAEERLLAYIAARHAPGLNVTRTGIIAALHAEGVHRVDLYQPAADITRQVHQAAWCPPENITLTPAGTAA
ncbi:MAG: baseplate J/gp47 family protein [Opitutales bacterium]|nr:baseplate J/gp47 family protein [Opitutales bacterium]